MAKVMGAEQVEDVGTATVVAEGWAAVLVTARGAVVGVGLVRGRAVA